MSRHLCDVAITGKGRAASRVALGLRCGECAVTACVLTFRTSRLRVDWRQLLKNFTWGEPPTEQLYKQTVEFCPGGVQSLFATPWAAAC